MPYFAFVCTNAVLVRKIDEQINGYASALTYRFAAVTGSRHPVKCSHPNNGSPRARNRRCAARWRARVARTTTPTRVCALPAKT